MNSFALPYYAGAIASACAGRQSKAGLLPFSFPALQHVSSILQVPECWDARLLSSHAIAAGDNSCQKLIAVGESFKAQ